MCLCVKYYNSTLKTEMFSKDIFRRIYIARLEKQENNDKFHLGAHTNTHNIESKTKSKRFAEIWTKVLHVQCLWMPLGLRRAEIICIATCAVVRHQSFPFFCDVYIYIFIISRTFIIIILTALIFECFSE